MVVNRYNMQRLSWAIAVVFSILVLSNVLVCLSPTFYTDDFYSALQHSFLFSQNQLDFAILDSIEIFTPARIVEIKNNKFIQQWKYFFYYVIFYINISLLNSAKLILCQFLFLASRVNKYIPIIALPIGGHDPPEKVIDFWMF